MAPWSLYTFLLQENAVSKKRRSIEKIATELHDETRRQLTLLIECNKKLQDSELTALKRLELSACLLNIWSGLKQVHAMIREANPSSKAFFDDLDTKLVEYEKTKSEAKNEPS